MHECPTCHCEWPSALVAAECCAPAWIDAED